MANRLLQGRTASSHKDLPPSVEMAYYRKCIELRRRINDIEENNDGTRLRIKRLNRAVTKMRLERAFLLEQLAHRMEYNVDESDRSSSPPPTVNIQFRSILSAPSPRSSILYFWVLHVPMVKDFMVGDSKHKRLELPHDPIISVFSLYLLRHRVVSRSFRSSAYLPVLRLAPWYETSCSLQTGQFKLSAFQILSPQRPITLATPTYFRPNQTLSNAKGPRALTLSILPSPKTSPSAASAPTAKRPQRKAATQAAA